MGFFQVFSVEPSCFELFSTHTTVIIRINFIWLHQLHNSHHSLVSCSKKVCFVSLFVEKACITYFAKNTRFTLLAIGACYTLFSTTRLEDEVAKCFQPYAVPSVFLRSESFSSTFTNGINRRHCTKLVLRSTNVGGFSIFFFLDPYFETFQGVLPILIFL